MRLRFTMNKCLLVGKKMWSSSRSHLILNKYLQELAILPYGILPPFPSMLLVKICLWIQKNKILKIFQILKTNHKIHKMVPTKCQKWLETNPKLTKSLKKRKMTIFKITKLFLIWLKIMNNYNKHSSKYYYNKMNYNNKFRKHQASLMTLKLN